MWGACALARFFNRSKCGLLSALDREGRPPNGKLGRDIGHREVSILQTKKYVTEYCRTPKTNQYTQTYKNLLPDLIRTLKKHSRGPRLPATPARLAGPPARDGRLCGLPDLPPIYRMGLHGATRWAPWAPLGENSSLGARQTLLEAGNKMGKPISKIL